MDGETKSHFRRLFSIFWIIWNKLKVICTRCCHLIVGEVQALTGKTVVCKKFKIADSIWHIYSRFHLCKQTRCYKHTYQILTFATSIWRRYKQFKDRNNFKMTGKLWWRKLFSQLIYYFLSCMVQTTSFWVTSCSGDNRVAH